MPDTKQRIHLIANAHLDPVWLWRWQEGCTEIRSTCRAAVDFLAGERTLKFARSSAGDMRWLEEMEPGLLRRIRRLVKAGRWENVGGWWTQPDCNLPCGESFVRQALYGQRYFMERLGAVSTVGYNVDSFGHHANLPQILRKCGMPYYVFMRPSSTLENTEIPVGYFHWEGIDGTRVLAYHLFDPYNATEGWGLDTALAACKAYLDTSGVSSAMLLYGMGDHGGAPTRATLAAIRRLRDEYPESPTLVHATPREAFAAIEGESSDLPIYRNELQHHASGCYAADSRVKWLNRRAEETLLAAERMAAVSACLIGTRYLAARFAAAWHDVLFSQFHDILSGSAIREAYTDTYHQLGRAIFSAEEMLNAAQQGLAAQVDTRGEGQAILLFNPHPFPVSGLYETENMYGGGIRNVDYARAQFVDAHGQALPAQGIRPTGHTGGIKRFVFPVALPPLGYALYRLQATDTLVQIDSSLTVGEQVLENAHLRVTVTPEGIQLDDLTCGRMVLRAPGMRALVMDDPSDTWGHDYTRFDQLAGVFTLVGVRILEPGPLRGALRAEYRFGDSRLWLDILLDHDQRAVELRGKLWWLEKQRILKLAFPVAVESSTATHEIPYAALTRPNNGKEEPMQQWIDLADDTAGLVVINDGKYSVSVDGTEIRQTIVRSTPYGWCRCAMYPWDGEDIAWEDADWMHDQGIEEFRLRLMPHDGDRDAVGVIEAARLFNRAPALMVESSHGGTLPTVASFVQVTGNHVRIEVVKGAEDGRGLILRAVETAGGAAHVQFTLPTLSVQWSADFTPWEIKTFRVVDGHAREEAMLEMALTSPSVPVDGSGMVETR